MKKRLSKKEAKIFHKIWVRALFDIINGVTKNFYYWPKDDQNDLILLVVRELAMRYRLIEDEIADDEVLKEEEDDDE